MPRKRRYTTNFIKDYALKFGVRLYRKDSQDDRVISAECLFCIHFCRERKVGAKSLRTSNTKYYKFPFRSANYTQHLSAQHPGRWAEYQDLSVELKKTFFDNDASNKTAFHGHFGSKQILQTHNINAPIIDRIIGEVL